MHCLICVLLVDVGTVSCRWLADRSFFMLNYFNRFQIDRSFIGRSYSR